MITFFTTAKSFTGPAARRQRNAIRSWQALDPEIEIMLFGAGEGYEDACRQLNLVHVPDVLTNERGVPRIDSMFKLAEERGRNPVKAYINCDIILSADFMDAVRRIRLDRFLMVAQRWDVDDVEKLPFASAGWQAQLRDVCRTRGELRYPGAIDFFLTRGNVWRDVPPMVVGRGMYDHWLIYYCRARRIPVVDATEVVTVVHQNHDYGHVAGGKKTVEDGDEARRNLELGGGYRHMFTIQDADWKLTLHGLVRNWCRGDSQRCGEVFQIVHPGSRIAQSWVGRLGAEACCEVVSRWRLGRQGELRPMLKFIPWLLRRMVKLGI